SDERAPWNPRTLSNERLLLAMLQTQERFTSFEEALNIDVEDAIPVNYEAPRRSAGPRPCPLGGSNPGSDTAEVLFVLDLGEVAHDAGDHSVDGSLDGWIVDVNRETEIERF